MAGLNLGGGMGTLGTASFGSGFMQGMDKARQQRREDEADAQRQQAHGLQMRTGEQSYAQREELFPMQKQTMGLQLKEGQRKEEISSKDHDALMLLWQGAQVASEEMRKGNPMAANESNAAIMEQLGVPTTIWTPTPDGKIGRYDPNNMDEPLDVYNNLSEASQAYINNSRELFKQLSPSAFKKELEREPKERTEKWSPMGNSGWALESGSGQARKIFDVDGKDGGRGGRGGGLKYSDENTMNRWVEGYYGKRDAMGQFVLTEEQKYQAVEAQERAIAMLNADPSLSMSQAYQLAVGSVSGKIPLSKAEELAAIEAEEQGIQKTIKGTLGNKPNPEYNEFIKSRAQEIVRTGQDEADYLYRQITGMPQQAMQVPQQDVQPQQQVQIPQGRRGSINGRRVVVTPENHIFDEQTGERLQ